VNGEIREAANVLEERKDAIVPGQSEMVGDDEARLMVSGLDLDLDELCGFKREVGFAFIAAVRGGINPVEAAFGLWVDGLVTGLILAERRARAGASA
jgi:hypothetical protein